MHCIHCIKKVGCHVMYMTLTGQSCGHSENGLPLMFGFQDNPESLKCMPIVHHLHSLGILPGDFLDHKLFEVEVQFFTNFHLSSSSECVNLCICSCPIILESV